MRFFRREKNGNGRPTTATMPALRFGADIESLTQQIGREIVEAPRGQSRGFFSSRFWSDKLMEWATKDQNFKVQLFRFIDAAPMLSTPELIHEHLVDYLTQPGVTPPPGMALGLKAGGLLKGTFASTVTNQIQS